MRSTPLRKSVASPADFNARSKLSSAGRKFLMTSAAANSRKSCCSRAARLRALSNSACRRARRRAAHRAPPSAFLLPMPRPLPAGWPHSTATLTRPASPPPAVRAPDLRVSAKMPVRFSVCFSHTTALLRFVQSLSNSDDIGHRRHRVLIVKPGRQSPQRSITSRPPAPAPQSERNSASTAAPHPVRSPPYRFLPRVQIRTQQLHHFSFSSSVRSISCRRERSSCPVTRFAAPSTNTACVSSVAASALVAKLLDRLHQPSYSLLPVQAPGQLGRVSPIVQPRNCH